MSGGTITGHETTAAAGTRQARPYPNARPQKTYGKLNSQRNLSTYGRTDSRPAGSSLKRASAYSSSSRGSSRSSGSRGK